MRFKLSTMTAALAAGFVVLATALSPVAANATTQPPWEPDTNAVGTITFFDSSGTQITSGSITDAPLAAYAVGSALPRAGDTHSVLEFAQPNPLSSDPLNWTAAGITALATTFPVTGAGVPTDISSLDANHPVNKGAANDASLQQDIAELPNTGPSGDSFDGSIGCAYSAHPAGCTNATYQNLYQLRMVTTNGSSNTIAYDDADILLNPTTGVWSQVYPAPPVATNSTTTTLAVTPSTSSLQGASVTLTASIMASDASSPAGSVQFQDNGANLGTPVTVNTTGETAVLTTSKLLPGHHSLTASFVATDTVNYGPSTSTAVSYRVNPKAKTPTITGTARVGRQLTCNEPTTLGEAVSFEWKLNGKKAGTGRTFTLPGAAAKKSVTCTVTVTVSGGTPSSATSAAKKVAVGAALKATKKPTLSGAHKVGKKESVAHGKWSPAATSYRYQWLVGGKVIKGATKASLVLKSTEKGKLITCRVKAHRAGYATGSATTKRVKVS
jgi:Bacterial Ig-like domain (group 3)